jgi:hypothetical protein
MGHEISLLPEALPDDVEDVTWALSTAAALWGRGELKEALVWVRRAAEAAGAAGQDGRAVSLAKNAAALDSWMAAPTSPETKPADPDSKAALSRPLVASVPPPKPPPPRVAAENLPEIEPEFLEEETNDLRTMPAVEVLSAAEAPKLAASSPPSMRRAPEESSAPAIAASADTSGRRDQSTRSATPPAKQAPLEPVSKLGALADEPSRPQVRRPTLDGRTLPAPTHPAPAAGAATLPPVSASAAPAVAAPVGVAANPTSTASAAVADGAGQTRVGRDEPSRGATPPVAVSVPPVSSARSESRTNESRSALERLTSAQEQAARDERRAQKKRQRAPILDPWSDELPPSDPPPRTVHQRTELPGADDADVMTSAPSLDITLKRKPPPPPPKRSGTFTGTVLAPVPESPESRRASELAAAQEESSAIAAQTPVTPPPSVTAATPDRLPPTTSAEAPASVAARPPPPRRPTLQPRASSAPSSERKSVPPAPRMIAEDREGAPPTMPAAQRKPTFQPSPRVEDATPSSVVLPPSSVVLPPAPPIPAAPPAASAEGAENTSAAPAASADGAGNGRDESPRSAAPPPPASAEPLAAIPPAAATLPMAAPSAAASIDDLTPIAPEVDELAERERRVSEAPPRPKTEPPPRPKTEPPPRPKTEPPPRPKTEPPVADSAPVERSLAKTLKTGVRTFELGGIALESVEPFRGLPDASLQLLREKATLTELGAEEEVGASGAVLLLEGSAVICAAVSDAAAHHLLPGTLASCTPTRSDATKIRVVGIAPSKVASWDRATLDAAVADAPAVSEELTRLGDRHAALAGSTMGPLGDLDESSRLAAVERMSARTFAPGEVFIAAGGELSGLTVVGSGAILQEDGREFGAGDVVLAELALDSRPLSGPLTAGEDGAVVLSATRMGTVELFSVIPTLLELLRIA